MTHNCRDGTGTKRRDSAKCTASQWNYSIGWQFYRQHTHLSDGCEKTMSNSWIRKLCANISCYLWHQNMEKLNVFARVCVLFYLSRTEWLQQRNYPKSYGRLERVLCPDKHTSSLKCSPNERKNEPFTCDRDFESDHRRSFPLSLAILIVCANQWHTNWSNA